MKKNIFASALVAMALTMGFTSCDKDNGEELRELDISPITALLIVENAEGQNLLDPNTPNNFVGDTIIAEWMGKTYVMTDTVPINSETARTRAIGTYMYGLIYLLIEDSIPALYFGQINATAHYDDEPATIHWPDGSTDVISITASYKWSEKKGPHDFVRKFKLNGKVISEGVNPQITLVK